MQLTARDRFLYTIKFKETDRPFRWETPAFWPTTIKNWKAEGLPEWVNDENINSYFDMDPIEFMPLAGGWTGTPFYPPFEVKVLEEDDKNIIRLEEDGIIKKQKKDDWDTSMPQFIKFPVRNLEDFNKIKWRLDYNSKERLPINWNDLVKKYIARDFPLGMFVCGSFGHPRNLLGDENLMYSLFDDQELIHEIMENWLELYQGFISLICKDVIPDFILIWEDMAYKNASLISPEHFKRFMAPYLKKLISFAKNKGIEAVILDSDGDIRKLIPLFIEAGVDAIMPFEVQAGMDIVGIRKQYGNSFAIIGGLDKKLLPDKKAIDEEVEKKVPFMLKSRGYFPSLDHSVPSNITIDSFKHYLDLVRKYK